MPWMPLLTMVKPSGLIYVLAQVFTAVILVAEPQICWVNGTFCALLRSIKISVNLMKTGFNRNTARRVVYTAPPATVVWASEIYSRNKASPK
jgi:hypothetical protein